jgi:hypothetical protein
MIKNKQGIAFKAYNPLNTEEESRRILAQV